MSQRKKKPKSLDTEQYICNLLREGTIRWSGRREALRRARKRAHDGRFYKNGNPVYKYFWQCNKCRDWFEDEKQMEVDHIVEIGPYRGNLHEYAMRMYCGQENLQVLCVSCHSKKTVAYNSSLSLVRKRGAKEDAEEFDL